MRSAEWPSSSSVLAASSATGRSDVPAAARTTPGRRSRLARRSTTRAQLRRSARPTARFVAAACAAVARVPSTGAPGAPASEDLGDLCRRLALAEDDLGKALPQRPMVSRLAYPSSSTGRARKVLDASSIGTFPPATPSSRRLRLGSDSAVGSSSPRLVRRDGRVRGVVMLIVLEWSELIPRGRAPGRFADPASAAAVSRHVLCITTSDRRHRSCPGAVALLRWRHRNRGAGGETAALTCAPHVRMGTDARTHREPVLRPVRHPARAEAGEVLTRALVRSRHFTRQLRSQLDGPANRAG